MSPVQVKNQVSKKNRTLSSVYHKQKKAVLFVQTTPNFSNADNVPAMIW